MLTLAKELSSSENFFAQDAKSRGAEHHGADQRQDDAALKREARKVTETGLIWPVARAEMRHAQLIRDRMLDDLEAIAARRDFVELYDLAEAGWPFATVERLGPAVVTAFLFRNTPL